MTGGNSAKKGLRNMEQQIKREVATQVAAVSPVGARKREVAAPQKQAGLSTQDLILIAVLLAQIPMPVKKGGKTTSEPV